MKKKVLITIIVFFLLYLILIIYASNYHTDNGIPIVDIRLNKITLRDIHNNSKSIKYENNIMTIDNNKYNITIKGRGNATWELIKRPYQISFDEKTSILDLEESKKYILLANYVDPSLLRNDFTFKVASKMDLKYSNIGKYIDLYVDKKYIGNYYLVPQVNINSSSVDIKDNNAILMELDNMYYESETYFITDYYKDHLTIKDQKNKDNNEGYEAFQNKYNLMEKNIAKKNYKWLKDNIDIESFIKYYIIVDFAKNYDSYQSSFYMYMDGIDDKIHVGPIWDFDNGYDESDISIPFVRVHPTILFDELLKIKDFKKDVSSYWSNNACKIYKEEIENLDKTISYLNESGEMNSMYWNNKHYSFYTDKFINWVSNRYLEYNKLYGCDES